MKQVFDKLRKASAFLGKAPSIFYALLYFLCIPLFAWFYSSLPDDFYHTTIKYEKVLDQDAQEILTDLRDAVTKNYKSAFQRSTLEDQGWVLNVETIELHSLRYEDSHFRFGMKLSLETGAGENKERLQTNAVRVALSSEPAAMIPPGPRNEHWTIYRHVTTNKRALKNNLVFFLD